MRVFYLFILFSFSSLATTCTTDENAFEQWNKKYNSLINVEANKSVGSLDVLVRFPETIENMPLHSVVLHLGEKEKPLFSSQLAIFEEDGQKAVFFTTRFEQKNSAYILASYGSDCGIQVEKSVELRQ